MSQERGRSFHGGEQVRKQLEPIGVGPEAGAKLKIKRETRSKRKQLSQKTTLKETLKKRDLKS